MLGWNLVYGTEAALIEARYADRLAIVDRNPLLLHAWYSTCKEAGVPVRTIEQRSEEEVLELLEQVSCQEMFKAAVAIVADMLMFYLCR